MRILILLVLLGLSLAELTTYDEFKIHALKHNIKNVEEYAVSLGIKDFLQQFEKFKIEFDKHYTKEEEEEEMRQFYFLKTLLYIEHHNNRFKNGDVTHDVGLNHLADWTPDELKAILNIERHEFNNTQTHEASDPTLYANLPPSFDWRQHNKVSPVKNQGQCGSCWAFTTVATLESAQAIKHNQFLSLSEQQLLDCSSGFGYNNLGCKGGWVSNAYLYVVQNGIEMSADYPYVGQQTACRNVLQKNHLRISGFRQLPLLARDEDIAAAIMTIGPVAVNIDASGNDFVLYKSGIISTGNRNFNHYVTAIGWGSENGRNYWIIKNSWGTGWGENGFGRMQRGVDIRGFNHYIFYPTLF